MLYKLEEMQVEMDKHMEQFYREQKIQAAKAIEVLRNFVITA
jgi:hypothetical protein